MQVTLLMCPDTSHLQEGSGCRLLPASSQYTATGCQRSVVVYDLGIAGVTRQCQVSTIQACLLQLRPGAEGSPHQRLQKVASSCSSGQRAVSSWVHCKGQGVAHHKRILFQRHNPHSGVSWGHTSQMCSYPAACGVPSPICSCPCSESYLLTIIHFPASRAARVQKHGQGFTYQMDPWPGDDSEGNVMSTKPRVPLQQGP